MLLLKERMKKRKEGRKKERKKEERKERKKGKERKKKKTPVAAEIFVTRNVFLVLNDIEALKL